MNLRSLRNFDWVIDLVIIAVVTAVNAVGAESTYSNTITAVIPLL